MELNNFKNEAYKLRMTPEEKAAMKSRLFGMPSYTPRQSPYFVFSYQFARVALAAVLVLVLAGGGTAYAAEGALPGSPLYTVKVNVNEPVRVALASTPAAKAAVNAQIATTRVEEAEALAQAGQLDATTSGELADNFEAHAKSATRLADEASSTDPSASVQIKAQIAVQAAVAGEVLAAIGNQSGNSGDREHAHAFAARVLVFADREAADARDNGQDGASAASQVRTFAAAAPKATSAVVASTSVSGSNNEGNDQKQNSYDENVAAGLEARAQAALSAARAQLAASTTLDASTTANIQASLGDIDSLIAQGSAALGASDFSGATSDFTQALSEALRLSALLRAQQQFDHHVIEPLFNNPRGGDSRSDGKKGSQSDGQDSNQDSGGDSGHDGLVPSLLNHL